MNIDEAMKKGEKESCIAHMNMILDYAATCKETSKSRMAFIRCFSRLMEMGVSISDIIKGLAESSTKAELSAKAEAVPSMPLLTVIGTLAEWGRVYGNHRIKGVEIRPDNTVYIDAVE